MGGRPRWPRLVRGSVTARKTGDGKMAGGRERVQSIVQDDEINRTVADRDPITNHDWVLGLGWDGHGSEYGLICSRCLQRNGQKVDHSGRRYAPPSVQDLATLAIYMPYYGKKTNPETSNPFTGYTLSPIYLSRFPRPTSPVYSAR